MSFFNRAKNQEVNEPSFLSHNIIGASTIFITMCIIILAFFVVIIHEKKGALEDSQETVEISNESISYPPAQSLNNKVQNDKADQNSIILSDVNTVSKQLKEQEKITLKELLIELQGKLNQEGVTIHINSANNGIIIVSSKAIFARSSTDLASKQTKDLNLIYDYILWAMSCHIEQGKREIKYFRSPCLKNKGRIGLHQIKFEGHTDSVKFRLKPSTVYRNNYELSKYRAKEFARLFVERFTARTKLAVPDLGFTIDTHGYGDDRRIHEIGSHPSNRRVEIIFIEKNPS